MLIYTVGGMGGLRTNRERPQVASFVMPHLMFSLYFRITFSYIYLEEGMCVPQQYMKFKRKLVGLGSLPFTIRVSGTELGSSDLAASTSPPFFFSFKCSRQGFPVATESVLELIP